MSDYPLFSVIGIEIEYMLVDRDTLAVAPRSDRVLEALAGKLVNEVALGNIAASNELVLHVLELKNNGPQLPQARIRDDFQQTIVAMQPLLAQHQLQLLPTGAHPWMNPVSDTQRWPHGNKAIYQQYDAIFNCQGHGWANLQSMHVNLPFATDDEFCHLHNRIRVLLPLLPALAASTPFLEGKATGLLDSRLDYYAKNQQRIPSISGQVIPEFIASEAEYHRRILAPMYRDIRPYDPQGILQHEWLNSRAAIAKFEMMAIEIRIIDSQECVGADIAIALAIHALLKKWHSQSDYILERPCDTPRLKALYEQCIKKGMSAWVDDRELLQQWQLPCRSMTVREVWSMLLEGIGPDLDLVSQRHLEHILSQGNISERLLRATDGQYHQARLRELYRQLADCLLKNQSFSVP
ncbi:MAG: glutamate--cysteine ligase [Legionellaceae bacterium]|nr:glutamate--cysteine ligase [Legionellaceae bacterium]